MSEIKALLKQAKTCFTQKNYEEAIKHLDESLKLEKNNFNSLLLKGACLEALDRLDEAMDVLFLSTIMDNKLAPWNGIFNICLKLPEKYHMYLVRVAVKLLSEFDQSITEDRRTVVVTNLFVNLIKFRIETPIPAKSCLVDLIKLSEKTPELGEFINRMHIDRLIMSMTPWKIGCDELPASLATELDQSLELAKCAMRLFDLIHNKTNFTDEDREILMDIYTCLQTVSSLEDIITEPYVLYMLAIIDYQLHNFMKCDQHCRKLLKYLKDRKPLALDERKICERYPSGPPSASEAHLSPRPMAQPLRSPSADEDSFIEKVVILMLANCIELGLKPLAQETALLATGSCPINDETSLDLRLLVTECWLLAERADFYRILWDGSVVETVLKRFQQSELVAEKFLYLRAILLSCRIEPEASSRRKCDQALQFFWENLSAYKEGILVVTCGLARAHDLFAFLKYRFDHGAKEEGSSLETTLKVAMNIVRMDSTYWASIHLAGHILLETGRETLAQQAFQKANRLIPCQPECAFSLAKSLTKSGMFEAALTVYQELDDEHAFSVEMWRNYGLACLATGEVARSVQALQKVVIAQPDQALNWEILGQAYLDRGSFETALKALHRAMKLDSTRPMPHFLTAFAYEKLGHLPEAAEFYQQVIELPCNGKNNELNLSIRASFKRIIEMKSQEASTNMLAGLTGQFLVDLQAILIRCGQFVRLKPESDVRMPNWLLATCAHLFHLCACIQRSDCLLKIPMCLLKKSDSENVTSFDLDTAVQLGEAYLSVLVKRALEDLLASSASDEIRGRALVEYLANLANLFSHQLAQLCRRRKQPANTAELERTEALCHCVLRARRAEIQALEECASNAAEEEQSAKSLGVKLAQVKSQIWHNSALLSTMQQKTVIAALYPIANSFLLGPNSAKSGSILAKSLMQSGELDSANDVLQHCLSVNSDSALVWMAQSELLSLMKLSLATDNAQIFKALLQAAHFGGGPGVVKSLLRILFSLIRKSIAPVSGAEPVRVPTISPLFLRLAKDITLSSVQRCLSIDELDPVLWHDLALLRYEMGIHNGTEEAFAKALSVLSTSNHQWPASLGQYIAKHRSLVAIPRLDFDKVTLSEEKCSPLTQCIQAVKLNKPPPSSVLSTLIDEEQDTDLSLWRMMMKLDATTDKKEARGWLFTLTLEDPTSPQAWSLIAYWLFKEDAGHNDLIIEYVGLATSIQVKNPVTNRLLCWIITQMLVSRKKQLTDKQNESLFDLAVSAVYLFPDTENLHNLLLHIN